MLGLQLTLATTILASAMTPTQHLLVGLVTATATGTASALLSPLLDPAIVTGILMLSLLPPFVTALIFAAELHLPAHRLAAGVILPSLLLPAYAHIVPAVPKDALAAWGLGAVAIQAADEIAEHLVASGRPGRDLSLA